MININRKENRRGELCFKSENWREKRRKEEEEEEKRWENKGKRKGVGGNKFKGKIMYKCVFFKP